jgi:hypothetical protein
LSAGSAVDGLCSMSSTKGLVYPPLEKGGQGGFL